MPERRAETDPGYEGAQRRQLQTLFADWTPPNLAAHDENVEVYSNCGEVELSLNGKSLGAKTLPADAAPRTWRVTFEPGAIDAACKNGPREELRTAGKASKITLSLDRAKLRNDRDDVAYVTASVTDDHGVIVPEADATVTFQVSGPGAIAAVDSADNTSHEPFQANTRRVYDGWCVAVIRGSGTGAGKIAVSASGAGLASGSVTIEVGPR
jgi:beta-galactosidase